MAITVDNLAIKSQDEIRDDMIRTYRNGLIAAGVQNPDVSAGTEFYLRATAIAQQIFAASNNTPVAANAQMPDTAQGDDMVRIGRIYVGDPRTSGSSSGRIILAASVSTPIAITTGQQLIDSSSNTYRVSVGGNYAAGDPAGIPVTSISLGEATNLPAGTSLRWLSGIPYVQPTALVATGGLTGGVNAEGIEGLRGRTLQKLRFPPNGTNWPTIVGVGNASSTQVQATFVYPACNGPSTEHVAVTRAPTATNKGRTIDPVELATVVTPAIIAAYPQFVETVVTGTVDQPTDVSVGLTLPSAPTAVPPGPGGGWIDAAPWPTFTSAGFAAVTSVTSSTSFAVNADVAPVVGDTVCWLSRDDWTLRTAKVTAPATGTGPWGVVVDTPFVSALNSVAIAVGDYVFPGAVNAAAYVAAALTAFAAMGPGEKTDNVTLLPRAQRRPYPAIAWPAVLGGPFLRALEDAGEEVAAAAFLFPPSGAARTPTLPATIGLPPAVLVPRRLGFYPAAS